MKALPLLLAAACVSPAAAQHSEHAAMPAAAPDPSCPPEHAAMGHCTPAAPAGASEAANPPAAAPSARALSGPRHAADRIYDDDDMAEARTTLRGEHGDVVTSRLLIEELETGLRGGRATYAWEAKGWYGGDIDRLWLASRGEGAFGEAFGKAEVQLLYSRATDPWFNLQAGIRQDVGAGPDRTHFVLGIQGLAPYWLDLDGALFLSTRGELTARFEAEYDQRLTRKLILQPNAEIDLAAQDIPALGIGAGLSRAELGLRLRYAFVPEFAPYVGISYERAFGPARGLASKRGDDSSGLNVLIGLRAWF